MANSFSDERQHLLKEKVVCYTKENIVIWTKFRVIYNSIVLFLIFVGNMTSYKALIEIQSSVNGDIGIYSIALGCVFKILSSFLGPKIVQTMTPKWALFLSSIFITCFTIANCFPTWYVLVPAGALVGMFTAPMWICYGIYVTSLGIEYAKITNQNKEDVLSRLNGFMAASVPLAIAMGNFWCSFILKNIKFENNSQMSSDNSTDQEAAEDSDYGNDTFDSVLCGPNFCPHHKVVEPSSVLPDIRVFYLLLSILACYNISALLLSSLGLRNLSPDQYQSNTNKSIDNGDPAKESSSYMKRFFDWRFILLTPPMAYISFFMTLVVSMFPRAFITCNIGVEMIGYIFLARGISDFLTCKVLGFCGQILHRTCWLGMAFICVTGGSSLLLSWNFLPLDHMLLALFFFAAIGGVANSINTSQYSAFLGATFSHKKTEVFSYSQFIQSITGALGFYSNVYLCARYQLYVMVSLSLLACITYSIFCCCITVPQQLQISADVKGMESGEQLSEEERMERNKAVN